MAKHRERKSTNTLGARVIIATIRNAIDTLRGKVERDPIAARSSRGWGVRDVDVEAEVDPVPEDPKTMGGPIAQDLLPLPRHGVFSVREPRSTCRNPGKGRMSTRLLSARFSAHADPDSVWTSSRAPPLRPAASLCPRFGFPSFSTSTCCLVLDRSLLRGRCRDRDHKKVSTKDMLDVMIRRSEIRLQVQRMHMNLLIF